MRCITFKLFVVAGALTLFGVGASVAQPFTVNPGWDLFATQTGTTYQGVPFVGVSLGTYNFGSTIGVQNVGDTDTIIQRLTLASSPSQAIPVQMDALQLETAAPVSLGGGPFGNYFITLQSARGGPLSTGSMTINFGPDTFTSSLDIFFDIRFGALNGPIVNSSDLLLSNPSTPWSNLPPPNAVLIDGANYLLNGVDTTQDFWPIGPFAETEAGATHVVDAALTVPEPATNACFLLGATLFVLRRFRISAAS